MKFFQTRENTDKTQIDLEQKEFSESLPLQVSSETSELLPLKNSQSEQPATKVQKTGAWAVFASTFVTIFLAEIGDKTQITTLLMTAESQSPWIVFLGAGSALVTTSLLGVLLGQWLASRLSPKTVERAAGIILLLISLTLVVEVFYENFPG
ncbi:MAG: TMEM165/GDT1 family protein [Okeania sp. SIO3H1]|uniref:TMEM165/GDT1 family protein n=1 Tax=Okeania sp. SIO1I7 TaxID=2607772 RepID=UPI0013CD18A0|nr:TMEM165/GDT1 family protein [Okeania sp. SIO1I7]NEN92191.1 TMEM165/GDT1 family protein [Okeania sp. SIO3H1]NET27373.1 TMEM165/GDT1 family protein [Okeania sp. SIO1I7]